MQPLSGLLVLDFSTLLPGPLAALMLAEAGAEVIKIERPGGEDMRRFPPLVEGESAVFALLNRGKQVLTLDLKNAADREKLKPLLARADILIEQFRPGVMARLGLGYDDVRALNPRLIYCSISGYGQSGPRVHEAGHDINYIGNTGVLDLQPGPVEAPVVPPMLAADIAGGSFPAVINILLALRARDQSGEGAHVDIAMTDAMFTFAWYALALGTAAGRFPKPGELPLVGGFAALSALCDQGRQARRLRRASSRNSGRASPRRSDCRRNSSTTRAIRKRRMRRWRSSSPRARPRNGGRFWRTPIAAPPSSCRCRGDARSAFHRARTVRARDRDRVGQDLTGVAAADRAAVPRAARAPRKRRSSTNNHVPRPASAHFVNSAGSSPPNRGARRSESGDPRANISVERPRSEPRTNVDLGSC